MPQTPADVPAGFIDTGERFPGGPVCPMEAHVAAHDYAHEGYFYRKVRVAEGVWGVYVQHGRTRLPRCCVRKRSWVPEVPVQLWEPRSSPSLRRRTGHTRAAG